MIRDGIAGRFWLEPQTPKFERFEGRRSHSELGGIDRNACFHRECGVG
jgi:hypothetical protein